ncbi:MAG TPA: transposase family protein [Candidatus Competibacter sp.]|nr:transposase family protein [Candidatus Competibacteraceae bacterium]HPE74207.1 transposase family protein [Candidatus Competibacter sp.]HRW67760.1 transposase family protein [Candidatus Competibacter sp.]
MLLPTFLAAIPDHRRAQGRRYGLEHLLLFSMLAILADATSYRKIQRFITARLSQLNALRRPRWKQAPAHTAIRYTLQGIPPSGRNEPPTLTRSIGCHPL